MEKYRWVLILVMTASLLNAQKPNHKNEIGFAYNVKLTPYETYDEIGNIIAPDYDFLLRKGNISYSKFDNSQFDKLLSSYENYVFSRDSFPLFSGAMYMDVADAGISTILNNEYTISGSGFLFLNKPDRFIKTFSKGNTDKPYSLTDSLGRTDHIYLNYDYYTTTLKESIESLAFIEDWSYDRSSGVFNKKILGMNIAYKYQPYEDYYEGGETRIRLLNDGYIVPPPFQYKKSDLANQKKPGVKHKTELINNVEYEVFIKNQSCDPGYGESNIYNNIEPAQISELVYDLLQSVKEGKIEVYNLMPNGEVDFSTPLPYEQVILNLENSTREIEGLSEAVFNKYKKAAVIEVWETFHPDEVPEGVTPDVKEIIQSEEAIYQYDEYGEMKYDDNWEPILDRIEIQYDTIWGAITDYDTVWHLGWMETKIERVDGTREPQYQYTEYGDVVYDEDTWEPVITGYYTYYDTIYKPGLGSEYVELAASSKEIIKDIIPHNQIGDITGLKFYESWFVDPDTFSFYKLVKGLSLIVHTQKINTQDLITRCSIYNPMEEKEDLTFRLLYFKLN